MMYRVAEAADLTALSEMRWEWRANEDRGAAVVSKDEFVEACTEFLKEGLNDGSWTYWLAEQDGEIISNIFIQRVAKVPKPNRLHDELGYLTNVYTKPAYRGRGTGADLLKRVVKWAADEDLELLIVWPDQERVGFYQRHGFKSGNEVMEYLLRP